jgi:hypothetical protein
MAVDCGARRAAQLVVEDRWRDEAGVILRPAAANAVLAPGASCSAQDTEGKRRDGKLYGAGGGQDGQTGEEAEVRARASNHSTQPTYSQQRLRRGKPAQTNR